MQSSCNNFGRKSAVVVMVVVVVEGEGEGEGLADVEPVV
jgi:hypothetical protein